MAKIDLSKPKRLYRNSECEFCNDIMKLVKLKEHPKTKETIIICKECYVDLVKKNRANC